MALTPLLRAARPADGAALAAIELECFPDASWRAEDFLRYDCTVAELDNVISGFVVSRETFSGSADTPPEREVLNIAVKPEFRRQGLGAVLLNQELKRKANIFLEVRESNVVAIQLYKNAGFIELSRRRGYYDNPRESAIVMRLKW